MKKKLPNSSNSNYFIARETCLKECICNMDKSVYKISNVVWEYNQNKLMTTRKNLNDLEKDDIIKKQIFFTLKEELFKVGGIIHSSAQRLPLVYREIFVNPSDDSKCVFELCEDCWVLYNQHKGS
jgi:hypothetical protein